MDIANVDLHPWQKDLMCILEEVERYFGSMEIGVMTVKHGCSAISSRIMDEVKLLD